MSGNTLVETTDSLNIRMIVSRSSCAFVCMRCAIWRCVTEVYHTPTPFFSALHLAAASTRPSQVCHIAVEKLGSLPLYMDQHQSWHILSIMRRGMTSLSELYTGVIVWHSRYCCTPSSSVAADSDNVHWPNPDTI